MWDSIWAPSRQGYGIFVGVSCCNGNKKNRPIKSLDFLAETSITLTAWSVTSLVRTMQSAVTAVLIGLARERNVHANLSCKRQTCSIQLRLFFQLLLARLQLFLDYYQLMSRYCKLLRRLWTRFFSLSLKNSPPFRIEIHGANQRKCSGPERSPWLWFR